MTRVRVRGAIPKRAEMEMEIALNSSSRDPPNLGEENSWGPASPGGG